MFQIAYEYPDEWPDSGPLKIEAQLKGEIQVSPEEARRKANGYITMYIGILIGADDPVLAWGDPPVWRFTCYLHLPHIGRVAPVGTIAVDTFSGEVMPLSDETIQQMQDQASDLAIRYPSEAGAVS